MNFSSRIILMIALPLLFSACGSGGSNPTAGPQTLPVSKPGSATLVAVDIGTQAASPATVLYAVQLTLRLPAGVSVAADAGSGEVPASAFRSADGSALSGARYQPAAAGNAATVRLNVADPSGFTVGPLATLFCNVGAGTTLGAADFAVEQFSARDRDGAAMAGITAHLSIAGGAH